MPISRDSYNLQILQLEFASFGLRRNVVDIMFIYYLLNDLIDSTELLSLISFNIINNCLRKNNLFQVTYYKNNYLST